MSCPPISYAHPRSLMVGRRFPAWVKGSRKGDSESIDPTVLQRPPSQLGASSSGSAPTSQRRNSDGEQSRSAIRFNLSLQFDFAQQVEQHCRFHPFLVIISLFRAQLVMRRHKSYLFLKTTSPFLAQQLIRSHTFHPSPTITSPFWTQQAERRQGSQLFLTITPPFLM